METTLRISVTTKNDERKAKTVAVLDVASMEEIQAAHKTGLMRTTSMMRSRASYYQTPFFVLLLVT